MSSSIEWILALSSLHTKVFKYLDKRLSVHSISFSEFFVMYQLSQATDRTMRRIDLAESVSMSASGVTRLLNPMEKLGLVQKESNARDARVSLVKLSNGGLEVFNDALYSLKEAGTILLEPLDKESMDAFMTLAKKML